KADSAEISEEKAFPLIYSKNTNLWFGDVQISEPGLYNLTLRAEDGTKKISNTAANSIFVEKPGKVVDAEKQTAINGAKVSVYQYSPDDYNYVLWPGEVFNQANPQITGADGFYRLILPPGKYYLKVEAGGFRSVFSDTFELEGHEAISLTISLSKMPAFSINLPFLKNIKLPLPNLPQIFGVKYASSKTAEVVVPEKISALLGKPAPIFSLPDLNGELLGIRNLRGKKVIITTWASWAPLAQVQIPILDQLQREEKEDVRVLLISPHLSAGIVDTYLRRGKYNLASVIDEEGKFGKLYPVLTIPEHFFIDRRGILRDVYVGLLDGDGLKKKLSELQ
ncbi:MAG: redoxin domain-containing protein, partial [bacterium]|nr:redoxin domain-containing protein [bacterium]